MARFSTCWLGVLLLSAVAPSGARAAGAADDLAAARKLFLTGKYAESQEAYEKLADGKPVEAALGIARCLASVGKRDEAAAILEAAAKKHSEAAALAAELARLAFERGDYPAAQLAAAAALKTDPDQLAARWVQAELARTAGRLDEADAAYKRFVDYYNGHDVDSPDDLRYIGLAAAQFARWHRLSSQFSFLVNDLYPDAIKLDESYWPAHLETGLLFLEKYNQAEASRSLKQALAINPNSAEVHAALAALALQNFQLDDARRLVERALEIDPTLQQAYVCRADSYLSNYEAAEAIVSLEKGLPLNPVSELTLGRLAAAYAAVDGSENAAPDTRLGTRIAEVDARNPHAGEFYESLAAGLDQSRKYPAAARYYREAVERMPQLTSPRGALGLMHMRLGDEVEAKKLLDESFEVDPFNVRVSNSLKVLEVLDGYAILETDHFVLKFDRGQDELLARYAARYLEDEVYPQLVEHFAFKPEGKSLFEIFSHARNTSGHGWFSARMVGLPAIHTIGACAGKMVALASPNDLKTKFNWARVVKHEFVHVLNLQQTHFNIPHWFTEALAVESEGYPRPQSWNDLLAERVPKGDLFNLDTINLGFVRPKSQLEWNLAYCQAQLYAQCMQATYGDDALAKMLVAYRDNLDTRGALKRSFGVEQEAFEQTYLAFVEQITAGLSTNGQAVEKSFSDLEKARAAKPDDSELTAQLAYAHLQRKQYPKAGELAKAALKADPEQQLAVYVLARLKLLVGETEEALEMLEGGLDRQAPQKNLLSLLAGLKLKAKQYDAAAELYELGARREPGDLQWTKSLAKVYLLSGDDERLAPLLARLAQADPDDLKVRMKLAQIALAKKDFAAAADWANQANQIDVQDPEIHRAWAEALAGAREFAKAAEEYETAVRLAPDDEDCRLALAETWRQAGQPAKARQALEALLKKSPDHEGARAMLEKLKP
ncbi:MAG TPA: tetratricopeptide repeat protein [Pirellulales bacterium]|nr:tetratricopeptide repeat protein [Pirellulales bacterium]